MIRIHILAELESKKHVYQGDEVTIGSGGDLALSDPAIARLHCRVFKKGNQLILIDLGSAEGTYVNGERLKEPRHLGPSDIVELGAVKLSIEAFQSAEIDEHPTPINAESPSSTHLPTIESQPAPAPRTSKPRTRSAIAREALSAELLQTASRVAKRLIDEEG